MPSSLGCCITRPSFWKLFKKNSGCAAALAMTTANHLTSAGLFITLAATSCIMDNYPHRISNIFRFKLYFGSREASFLYYSRNYNAVLIRLSTCIGGGRRCFSHSWEQFKCLGAFQVVFKAENYIDSTLRAATVCPINYFLSADMLIIFRVLRLLSWWLELFWLQFQPRTLRR